MSMDRDLAAVAFAGGGARCYWQGGFWDALNATRPQRPDFVVGVSGGAFQACFSLIGAGDRVRKIVFDACAATRSGVDWGRLSRAQSPFLVGEMYRALLTEVFGAPELAQLRRAPEIFIQVARPPRWMPGSSPRCPRSLRIKLKKSSLAPRIRAPAAISASLPTGRRPMRSQRGRKSSRR